MLEADADDDDDDEDDEPAMLPTSSQESKDESLKAWLEGEGVDFELAVGAVVVKEMRNAVYQKLGFTCSAGVAHNKVNIVAIVCCLCSCACYAHCKDVSVGMCRKHVQPNIWCMWLSPVLFPMFCVRLYCVCCWVGEDTACPHM